MNFDKLKAFLDYYLPMLGVPGSDTVIYKNHEEIFRYSSGFDSLSERTALTKDTVYNIYSCTKISTCVAALQLIERGEILVDDPVYIYLPEYKNLKVLSKTSDCGQEPLPIESPLLIKHLFTMTSGFDYNLNRDSIKKVMAETDGKCPTLEIVKALASDPLMFEPGKRYCYGLSHDILGGIIESVSGLTLEEYMQKNIFVPLGMTNTTFKITDENRGRLANQYDYDTIGRCAADVGREDNPFRFGTEYCSGGAGLLSTVDDYILLMDALANGGVGKNGYRVLSSRSVELMRSPMLTAEQQVYFEQGIHKGYDYCYGVRVLRDPAVAGTLSAKGAFGWDSKRMCLAISDPDNKIAIFHAEQIDRMNSIVVPRLINAVYSCLDEDL